MAIALLLVAGHPADASDRKFAYSYEATTMPKGTWELEQWVTWKSFDDGDRFDFRHEIEWGVTDNLQLALYLANWRYEDRDGVSDTSFKTSSLEAIYNLTDPTADLLGSALYGEVGIGPEELKLEAKFILQKNIGPWVIAGNSIIESEWEGDSLDSLSEKKGELGQTVGVSYQFTPAFALGIEGLFEIEIDDWKEFADAAFYIGPNFSWRKGNFFMTVAGLFQTTSVAGEPDAQTRLIAGFDF